MIAVKKQYIVDNNGETTNVVIAKKEFDRLVTYVEELEDIAAYDLAKEKKGKTVPWKQVRRK